MSTDTQIDLFSIITEVVKPKEKEILKSRSNVVTPWGKSDSATFWCDGITSYGTPSHGGIKVCKKLNELIPRPFRTGDGWYEEDCAANIVHYFLFEKMQEITNYEFTLHYSISKEEYFSKYGKDYTLESIKRWHAAEWQVFSGENMEEVILTDVPSYTTPEKLLDEHRLKVGKVWAEMEQGEPQRIEIGKTITFTPAMNYGSFNVESAEVIRWKKKGKALRDKITGKVCAIPSANTLKRTKYTIN